MWIRKIIVYHKALCGTSGKNSYFGKKKLVAKPFSNKSKQGITTLFFTFYTTFLIHTIQYR
jgi:hypothetical protein